MAFQSGAFQSGTQGPSGASGTIDNTTLSDLSGLLAGNGSNVAVATDAQAAAQAITDPGNLYDSDTTGGQLQEVGKKLLSETRQERWNKLALPKYYIQDETLLDACNSATGWYAGSGTTITLDNDHYKTEPAGLKITSTGIYSSLYRIGLSALMAGKEVFGIWLYIPDISQIEWIALHLAKTSSFSPKFSRSYIVKDNRLFENGWNWFVMAQGDMTPEEGAVWSEINAIRIQVQTTIAGVGSVTVGGLYYNVDVQPKIVLNFDDADESIYTLAYPLLQSMGIVASVYAIQSRIGTAGYMTMEQLYDLYNSGWDIGNHSKNHVGLTTLATDDEILAEIIPVSEFLYERGFIRSAYHLAYPLGAYNANIMSILKTAGILSARGTYPFRTYNGQGMMSLPVYKSLLNTTTIGDLYTAVDYLKAWGGTGFVYGHIFSELPSEDTYTCEISILANFLQYCIQEGVEVLCTSEWYRRLTTPEHA